MLPCHLAEYEDKKTATTNTNTVLFEGYLGLRPDFLAETHKLKIAWNQAVCRAFVAERRRPGSPVALARTPAELRRVLRFAVAEGRAVEVYDPLDHEALDAMRAMMPTGTPMTVLGLRRSFFHDDDALEDQRRAVEGHRRLSHAAFFERARRRYKILESVASTDAQNRRPIRDLEKMKMHEKKDARPGFRNRGVWATICAEAIADVERSHAGNPGTAEALFGMPIRAKDARARFLRDFVADRLRAFGAFEDAIDEGDPVLFHSQASHLLNAGLLTPRFAVGAVLRAYESIDPPPLNSVEGFVRQVLGWREYIAVPLPLLGPRDEARARRRARARARLQGVARGHHRRRAGRPRDRQGAPARVGAPHRPPDGLHELHEDRRRPRARHLPLVRDVRQPGRARVGHGVERRGHGLLRPALHVARVREQQQVRPAHVELRPGRALGGPLGRAVPLLPEMRASGGGGPSPVSSPRVAEGSRVMTMRTPRRPKEVHRWLHQYLIPSASMMIQDPTHQTDPTKQPQPPQQQQVQNHAQRSRAGARNLLMVALSRFFAVPDNMAAVLPYLTGESHISLRLIDWFVTNFAKKHNVILTHAFGPDDVHAAAGQAHFNVYLNYRAQLKAYSKQQFDPFRRRDRIQFFYSEEEDGGGSVETTIGQLNFFRWMLQNRVIDYVTQHAVAIERDMMACQRTDKHSSASAGEEHAAEPRSPADCASSIGGCGVSSEGIGGIGGIGGGIGGKKRLELSQCAVTRNMTRVTGFTTVAFE